MARTRSIYATSIGKKIAMAVAGVVWIGYVVGHLVGNLKVFTGAEKFNHYADFLRVMGDPFLGPQQGLWIARIILFLALAIHVVAFLQLWRQSASARRTAYKKFDPDVFSAVSRTMKWGGIAILLFILFHILHLTTGTVHPEFEHGNAYTNLVIGLQDPVVSGVYIVSMIALGLHLYHGTWSALQTLGFNNPKYNRWRRPVALGFAVVISAGYISIPVAVLLGIVGLP